MSKRYQNYSKNSNERNIGSNKPSDNNIFYTQNFCNNNNNNNQNDNFNNF